MIYVLTQMMRSRRLFLVFLPLVLAISATLFYFYRQKWPPLTTTTSGEVSVPLHIPPQTTASGTVTLTDYWLYGNEPKMLRVSGYFEGGNPVGQGFRIASRISNHQDGFGSGERYWYVPWRGPDRSGKFYFILEYRGFPLSAENYYLRLYFIDQATNEVASENHFTFPNRLKPKKRQGWNAEPLPSTRNADPIQVSLQKVETGVLDSHSKQGSQESSSLLILNVSENGGALKAWSVADISFLAASGLEIFDTNRVIPVKSLKNAGSEIEYAQTGTLWKEDGPWKVKVILKRTGSHLPDEIFETEELTLPPKGEFISIEQTSTLAGVPITFLGLGGGDAIPPSVKNKEPVKSPALYFEALADTKGASLKLISVVDENGFEFWKPKDVMRSAKGIFCFEIPTKWLPTKLKCKFALIHEQREVEFIVEPTFLSQTAENAK